MASKFLVQKKEFLAALLFCIIQQSKGIAPNLTEIAIEASNFMEGSLPGEPAVEVLPDFRPYALTEAQIREAADDLCHNCPAVAALNERSEWQKGDFIDLDALARNVANLVYQQCQEYQVS